MRYKLQDIVDVTMGQSPKSEFYNNDGEGVPFLQGNRTFGFKYPTFDTFTTMVTKEAKAGDVIMSVRAPVGDLNITPVDICLGRGVCSLRMKNGNQEFLYYMMKYYIPQLINKESGTVFGSVNRNDIIGLEINIPNDAERQGKISRFLSMLDEKIQINNKINNNLEQQAQAIFLEMFPNIFSSSASSTFQNLIEFSNGKKRPEATGNIPVYGGNGILAYTNQANAENCVIIGRVGAYCGNTFLCPEKCWTSDNAIQAKSKKDDSPLFIYYLLKNASLPSRHIGTGQPLMTQGTLNSIPVNEPSVQEISSFISICKPMHEFIFTNERQNMSLALLRDSLLPKLMSGELDVSDIDL